MEPFELRVAPNIVKLFVRTEKNDLFERISDLRGNLLECGIEMPKLRVRDFSYLSDNQCQILIHGRVVCTRSVTSGDSIIAHLEVVLHS
ncbi:FHIPEP family type III secretion protein [Gimesia panareensis]|uniref:FHIPEP family type III secretion protein n=1 Tax=Gimesia panareensis TaxID=2527978 RepID=UPI0011A2A4C2|nr:FHIPEP family type III secretion protein [Gimesia panareensis]